MATKKKRVLITGYQVLINYRQKHPERRDLAEEVMQTITEAIKSSQQTNFNPLDFPVFTGIKSLILGAFDWTKSSQGLDYWMRLHDSIDD